MPRRLPFTEEQAREAIASSRCWSEALRCLGYRAVGGNNATLKRHAKRWGIATDHFDSKAVIREARRRASEARSPKRPLKDVLTRNSTYNRGHLKGRLLEEGIKRPICELCGQGQIWKGRRMSLILDHINGIGDDNRLTNLRIVCPNCDATLDTHCGRNLPRTRLCVGCRQPFSPTSLQHRYCSADCFRATRLRDRGKPSPSSTFGVPHPERRKVRRPQYDQLMREIKATSYLAVGRRYGVSDNAVRKWVTFYENEYRRLEAERERHEDGQLVLIGFASGSPDAAHGSTQAA